MRTENSEGYRPLTGAPSGATGLRIGRPWFLVTSFSPAPAGIRENPPERTGVEPGVTAGATVAPALQATAGNLGRWP